MQPYPKIQSLFKRNSELKSKPIIEGEYTLPEFKYLENNDWIFTEKVDGINIRVILTPGGVEFADRTDTSQIPATLVKYLMERFLPQWPALLDSFPDGACLYGEGYGAGIQAAGSEYRADQSFILFDVKIGEHWLERADVEDVAGKLGIDVVPVLTYGTLLDMARWVKTGLMSRIGSGTIEGIVARPAVSLCGRGGERIITKLKHKDFATQASQGS